MRSCTSRTLSISTILYERSATFVWKLYLQTTSWVNCRIFIKEQLAAGFLRSPKGWIRQNKDTTCPKKDRTSWRDRIIFVKGILNSLGTLYFIQAPSYSFLGSPYKAQSAPHCWQTQSAVLVPNRYVVLPARKWRFPKMEHQSINGWCRGTPILGNLQVGNCGMFFCWYNLQELNHRDKQK